MKHIILWLSLSLFAYSANSAGQSCSEENTLKSATGGTASTITFSNTTSTPLKVYWIDFRGKRVLYKSLAAGASYRQNSFTQHPWVITDADEQCVYILMPEQANHQLDITDAIINNAQQISASSPEDVEKLFNLAEAQFPSLFPSNSTTQSITPWLFRHYPSTGVYLGINDLRKVYLTGGPWGNQLILIGTVQEILLKLQPLTDNVDDGVLNFSRPVDTRVGVGNPEAALNFQEGQTVNFVWEETQHLTVNGVRFNFQADGGTSWAYTYGNVPSISAAQVFKSDLGTGNIVPGPISVSIINNDNPLAPVFVTYTFE